MQETIFLSILILTCAFSIILVGIILIVRKHFVSIELKNKEMYSSIILAEEKERERLSRDVHDELGGLITSSRLTLESIYLEDKDSETIEKVNRIISILEMASLSARNASLELSPIALQNFGLKGALDTFPNLYTSHNAKFDINCNVENLNSSVEIGIFRIISEIINNSIKYSQANDIYVKVYIDAHDDLILEIGDNGIGFELDSISEKSNGLRNISNRCKVLNGRLVITTSKGNGCHYLIKFNKENYGKR
jgi:signal transduction histidine kinase